MRFSKATYKENFEWQKRYMAAELVKSEGWPLIKKLLAGATTADQRKLNSLDDAFAMAQGQGRAEVAKIVLESIPLWAAEFQNVIVE